MVEPSVSRTIARYLGTADRLLPGRIWGLYGLGSVALGDYRRDRSDIDIVVVIDGDLGEPARGALRRLHRRSFLRNGLPALLRGRVTLPGTVNATFVRKAELTRPVTSIEPIASHVGEHFAWGKGFDVNPVMWKVLAEHGVAFRGPDARELDLDPEQDRLRAWNLENLRGYWRPWAEGLLGGGGFPMWLIAKRWATAWAVLGTPRLHRTIATGEVVSKPAAGEYALDVFDACWHPLIREALAYWRDEPADTRFRSDDVRRRQSAEFALEVVADAERLVA